MNKKDREERNRKIGELLELGMSKEEVANEMGLAPITIYKIARDKLGMGSSLDSPRMRKDDVLKAIIQYAKEHSGSTPTIRQICELTGIKSTSNISPLIDDLVQDGAIERILNENEITTGIVVVGSEWLTPEEKVIFDRAKQYRELLIDTLKLIEKTYPVLGEHSLADDVRKLKAIADLSVQGDRIKEFLIEEKVNE